MCPDRELDLVWSPLIPCNMNFIMSKGRNKYPRSLPTSLLRIEPLDARVDVLGHPHVLFHCVVEAIDLGEGEQNLVRHERGHVRSTGCEDGCTVQ